MTIVIRCALMLDLQRLVEFLVPFYAKRLRLSCHRLEPLASASYRPELDRSPETKSFAAMDRKDVAYATYVYKYTLDT
jgi:hypothetical protein